VIKNERQYRITKDQADKFAEALRRAESASSSDNPLLAKASREALQSQLADLRADIGEYERYAQVSSIWSKLNLSMNCQAP
jgi:hypothetical protein